MDDLERRERTDDLERRERTDALERRELTDTGELEREIIDAWGRDLEQMDEQERDREQEIMNTRLQSMTLSTKNIRVSNLKGEEAKPMTMTIICMTNSPDYVAVPCGHTLTCHTCYSQWWKKDHYQRYPRCPQCKGPIEQCIKLFLQVDEKVIKK
mgnify:CR=1 FL=1